MHLQCPHCHNPIEVAETKAKQLVCPSCGSTIQLELGATSAWLPEEAPKRVGKFEFLEQLGVGAFGTVYKARDTELDRIVAIKIPRAGNVPRPEDMDRFLREARSAAQLKHPSIVSLYDAGQSEGACYLVSEFIQGATLAEQLTAKRFGFRQSAELIVEVADALHYAHEHGVVHRDIKPSNIMLDLEGRPHLMDFGLAKRAADEITMTLEGQVLGTPAYMSPEQARGEIRKVDARSDLYSLGVILYELLTGELPFRGSTRMLLVQVMQDEPRPPRRLNDRIPRDLETICLKAMAKEPGRRYPSARGLADDLRRWLKSEPIHARPVGYVEKAWRWSRRNPAVAALTAALAVVMIGGLATLTWLWIRADAQRQRAEKGESAAKGNQAQAEANLQLAVDAVEEYCTKVSRDPRLREKDLLALRRQLLETAARFHEKFTQQQTDDPSLRRRQGLAYHSLAQLMRDMGERRQALDLSQKAVAILSQLHVEDPADVQRRAALARGYSALGVHHEYLGEIDAAVDAMRKAIAILEPLTAEQPTDLDYATVLGGIYCNLGFLNRNHRSDLVAAREWFERAIRTLEPVCRQDNAPEKAQSFLVISYMNLAHNHSVAGQPDLGLSHARLGLELSQRVIERYPGVAEHWDNHARFHQVLAGLLARSGQHPQALEAYRQAVETHRKLVDLHPSVGAYRDSLAISLANLGYQRMEGGDLVGGLPLFDEAQALWERLVQREQDRHEYRRALGRLFHNKGRFLLEAKQMDQALVAFQRGVEHQKVAFEHAAAEPNRALLDALYQSISEVYRELRRPSEAAARTRERQKLWVNEPKKLFEVARELALCIRLVGAGQAELTAAEKAERQEYADQAMEWLRQAVAKGYKNAEDINKDKALDVLRDREDFKKLLAELEAGKEKK